MLLLINGKRPYYVLLKSGEVVEMPAGDILEICDSKDHLEIRRRLWEANYRRSPKTTIKPPWMEDELLLEEIRQKNSKPPP